MRIVIADDSIVVRQQLTRLLNELDDIVAEADNAPVAKYLVEMLKLEPVMDLCFDT